MMGVEQEEDTFFFIFFSSSIEQERDENIDDVFWIARTNGAQQHQHESNDYK